MASAVEIILIPTLMIVLGYVLKRVDILKPQDSNTLSKIVIDVSLPSLIFSNLATATISSDMLVLPVASLILSGICMIIAYIFCKSRGYSKVKTWTIMIAVGMMNSGFIGYPITLGVFGNDGFLHAIFYDLATSIIFVIYGMTLVSVFGGNRKDVVKQGLTFVPLWAVILGIIFNIFNIQLGYVFSNVFNYLGQSTVPLIMISLGLTIDFREIKSYLFDSLFVSSIRLVISPIVMFIGLSLIHLGGLSFKVAVLEASMSTAMNGLVLAINYDLDTKLMSSAIFMSVILSLFTLTGVISLLL